MPDFTSICFHGFRIARLAAWPAALLLLASGLPAKAQSADCGRIQAQIASLSRGDPQKSASYGRAAQKQRGELERTGSYAASIGCNNRQFLIFGQAPPPQCGAIESQMQRMRGNLAQLEAQSGGGQASNAGAIRDLTARFNSQCRAPQQSAAITAPQPRGLFEEFFGGRPQPQPQQRFEEIPLEQPVQRRRVQPQETSDEGDDTPHQGGSKAVCVRTCDGGFFPVSYSARRSSSESLEDMCHALCPNAEVKLFTYSNSGEIEDAVAKDGEAYTSLPNALKFQKKFDPACACKAQGQSWVQALAEAERVLGRSSRSDIVVTQQKADELARPKLSPGVRASARKLSAEDVTGTGVASSAIDVPASAKALDGAAGVGQPQFHDVTGPDGLRRRVRIVGPKQ